MREKLIELLAKAEDEYLEVASIMPLREIKEFMAEMGCYGFYADHLIANGVTIATDNNKWIPVTERLPESKEKVLVYGGRTEIWFNGTKQPMPSIHTGYLRGLGDGWFSWDHHDYICDVTHWMPLPSMPGDLK